MIYILTWAIVEFIKGLLLFTCTSFAYYDNWIRTQVSHEHFISSYLNETDVTFTCNFDQQATLIVVFFMFAATLHSVSILANLADKNDKNIILITQVLFTIVQMFYLLNVLSAQASLISWCLIWLVGLSIKTGKAVI